MGIFNSNIARTYETVNILTPLITICPHFSLSGLIELKARICKPGIKRDM
jgi:hypothetical protein